MLSQLDSTYLCELTAAQIQEILVLNGVLVQQYQAQFHRWVTIAQLPDLGQLTLGIDPEKVAEIDRRLHNREIVEFTATTTVMNINICNRYVFIPLVEQTRSCNLEGQDLWGRICLQGNPNSVWTPQDLSWVQALGQQLLATLNILEVNNRTGNLASSAIGIGSSASLADLAELIEKIADLESASQRKDEFINRVTHDLRAPLMNIKMAVRMLSLSLKNDPQIAALVTDHPAAKYLGILEQECDREVGLINNILDLQRLELAENNFQIEPIELSTWLPSAIEPFQQRAVCNGQQLIVSIPSWLPRVDSDLQALNKILTELLNNACKYTQVDGKIVVEIDNNFSSDWLTLMVKNQAEIADLHLPFIFDRFYRVPNGDRAQQGGTGLGLTLVRELVEQLNGRIDVASRDGWTEFSLKFPVVKLAAIECK